MKITFKKKPRRNGLARIGTGSHRASEVRLDGAFVGTVSPSGGGWRGPHRGWYFVVSSEEPEIPYVNTCDSLVGTEAEAKSAAKAWIKKHAGKVTR